MATLSSRELIKMLLEDGWGLTRISGSHHHFWHPTKRRTVTVPHPVKDLKKGTLNAILKQAGLK